MGLISINCIAASISLFDFFPDENVIATQYKIAPYIPNHNEIVKK